MLRQIILYRSMDRTFRRGIVMRRRSPLRDVCNPGTLSENVEVFWIYLWNTCVYCILHLFIHIIFQILDQIRAETLRI